MTDRADKLEAMAPRLAAIVRNRCVDDSWPRVAVTCYQGATSVDDLRSCRAQLTAEQQATLQREELDLMAAPASLPGLGDPGAAMGSPPAPLDPRLEALRHTINDAMKAVAAAADEASRAAAQQRLDALQGEKKAVEELIRLEGELTMAERQLADAQGSKQRDKIAFFTEQRDVLRAQVAAQQAARDVIGISAELVAVGHALARAVDGAADARSDAERQAAAASLAELRQRQAALEQKLRDARANTP
jgi:hypothetical protein